MIYQHTIDTKYVWQKVQTCLYTCNSHVWNISQRRYAYTYIRMSYHLKDNGLNKPNLYLRISTGSIVPTRPAYCFIVSPAPQSHSTTQAPYTCTCMYTCIYLVQLK